MVTYWGDALARIKVRRDCVRRGKDLVDTNEAQWKELLKLSWLERFVLECRELEEE